MRFRLSTIVVGVVVGWVKFTVIYSVNNGELQHRRRTKLLLQSLQQILTVHTGEDHSRVGGARFEARHRISRTFRSPWSHDRCQIKSMTVSLKTSNLQLARRIPSQRTVLTSLAVWTSFFEVQSHSHCQCNQDVLTTNNEQCMEGRGALFSKPRKKNQRLTTELTKTRKTVAIIKMCYIARLGYLHQFNLSFQ